MPMDKIIADDLILADSGFYWREEAGIKVLVSVALEEAGFTNGFSTRLGGVSRFPENSLNLAGFDEDTAENIYENRRRFLALFPEGHTLSSAWQVHGDGVKVVRTDADAANSDEKFDALISDLPAVLIGVKTADCVPVLIGDPTNKAFAAVHAGWRGTVRSIVVKAVDRMIENFGTKASDLVCAIGPAALCGNYEIGNDVIDAFASNFNDHERYLSSTREGHALIDLHLANADQLVSLGVMPENIFRSPFCTMERSDLFFSYRKEKARFGKTGRLMSVIGLA